VGIPPIFIGLYTIQLMKKKKQRRREQANGEPGHTYPPDEQSGTIRSPGYPLCLLQSSR
jgi:hypothetical protein